MYVIMGNNLNLCALFSIRPFRHFTQDALKRPLNTKSCDAGYALHAVQHLQKCRPSHVMLEAVVRPRAFSTQSTRQISHLIIVIWLLVSTRRQFSRVLMLNFAAIASFVGRLCGQGSV